MIEFTCSNLKIVCDENSGQTASVKMFGREPLSDNSPLFEMALRDEKGGEIKIASMEFAFSGCEKNNETTILSYQNGAAGLDVSVSRSCEESITSRVSVKNHSEKNTIEYVTILPFIIKDNLKGNGGCGSILWGYREMIWHKFLQIITTCLPRLQ